MVYSNTTVYGGNKYDISGHLHIFTILKHFMLLKCSFFRVLYVYTLSQTVTAYRAMQLRFFKVETMLNNYFKEADQLFSLNTHIVLNKM